jgi:hypothetical protein
MDSGKEATYELSCGGGRTKVQLHSHYFGDSIVAHIFNDNAHIGAVSVSEYDRKEKRTSTSTITRLGHKDDIISYRAAHSISKHTRKPCCVIVGIHLDNITVAEIKQISISDLLSKQPKGS